MFQHSFFAVDLAALIDCSLEWKAKKPLQVHPVGSKLVAAAGSVNDLYHLLLALTAKQARKAREGERERGRERKRKRERERERERG
jgi:hypothetical protein